MKYLHLATWEALCLPRLAPALGILLGGGGGRARRRGGGRFRGWSQEKILAGISSKNRPEQGHAAAEPKTVLNHWKMEGFHVGYN